MEQHKWQRRASIVICVTAAVAVVWLAVKYLFWAVLPFGVAWAVALAVRPVARWVSRQSGLSYKVCSAVVLIVLLGAVSGVVSLAVSRLVGELEKFMSWLRQQSHSWDSEAFRGRIDHIMGRIPFVGKLLGSPEAELWREHIADALMEAAGSALSGLARIVPAAVLSTLGALPSLMLSLLVTLIACFYFAADLDRIHRALLSMLSPVAAERARELKMRAGKVVKRFLGAYFLLFLINFSVLSIGFAILRVDCVLMMALLCASVDVLPVLGTGVVILPWAGWMLLTGDYVMGIGLVVVYAAVTVIHQIAEPYVVGGSLGVHPLLTLVAMYVGFRLFGIVGLLLFPAATVLALGALPARRENF